MKIILADYYGFCYGVKRAIQTAEACIGQEQKTYTLGPIIHNPQMVAHLKAQGIDVADNVADVDQGTIVIRSHGVGPAVYKEAEAKGLQVVDATCPHVQKAQQEAHKLWQQGYQVVIVGEHNHQEVKSIAAWTDNKAVIVETLAEAQQLPCYERLGVVSQTTFAGELFEQILAVLKEKCREMKVSRTICTATDQRQQAAVQLAKKVDVMIVVGGKNSANTARLAQLCKQAGTKVYHIETAAELKQAWFNNVKAAGITAGASTPDWVIEEVYQQMKEFDEMLTQGLNRLEAGSIITGKVVGVRRDEVFVDVGYKAEGVIPLSELAYPVPEQASEVVSVGDVIDVYVIDADTAEGAVKLSKVKADKIVAWDKVEAAFKAKQAIEGKVTEVIKGGLAVSVFGLRAFIPASHVALNFIEDLSPYVGQVLTLMPIEFDRDKQRIVLSRRVILEEERRKREEQIFATIKAGQTIKGTVRHLASFGAFVDVGGVDGLIHISDLSWHRVKSPAEVLAVGDEVEAFVLKVDPVAKKISLSLKAIQRDPWLDAVDELSEGMIVKGKVTKLAKFGAFVELKPGVEGLVHLSELADHRVAKPEDVVAVGQEVSVKVLGIDRQNKKISLSIAAAAQDKERAEYQAYLGQQETNGVTIGDKLGHLFKGND